MKIAFLLALVAALTTSVSKAGEMWVYVNNDPPKTKGPHSGLVTAIDAGSVVYGDKGRKAWVYWLEMKGEKVERFYAAREIVRCDQGERAYLQTVNFDSATGDVADSNTKDGLHFEAPIPGTVGESIQQFICDLAEGTRASSKSNDFLKVRAITREEFRAMAPDFAASIKAKAELELLRKSKS